MYKILIVILFVILVIKLVKSKNVDTFSSLNNSESSEIPNNVEPVKCVCVFDLDDTLTCGLDNAKNAIDECKSNKCDIGINTARPYKYIDDINMDYLGLRRDDIKYFYTGPVLYTSYFIARKKLLGLDDIYNKYNGNIEKSKIILFDDNVNNIRMAEENGYSVVHANDIRCGLNDNIKYDIYKILNGVNNN